VFVPVAGATDGTAADGATVAPALAVPASAAGNRADGGGKTSSGADAPPSLACATAFGRRAMRLTLRHTVGTRMQWPASQQTSRRSSICAVQRSRVRSWQTRSTPKCMSRMAGS
jgi:hypothetical protein